MQRQSAVKFIVSICIPLIAGVIGSYYTMDAIPTWYSSLTKPMLSPPNWVFGPVWTVLYVLMGIALYLVWIHGLSKKVVKQGVLTFAIQLGLNTAWSIVFFGLKDPGLALGVIAALIITIVATIFAFFRVSKTAAYLMIPYLMWVSFASYLNYSIWMLN